MLLIPIILSLEEALALAEPEVIFGSLADIINRVDVFFPKAW
jgi:hypothetical protein